MPLHSAVCYITCYYRVFKKTDADDIYHSDQDWEEIENSTVTTVDLSTRKINFDKTVTKQLQTNDRFQDLSEFMVDIVGHHIRKKVKHLFDLKGRLWVAR